MRSRRSRLLAAVLACGSLASTSSSLTPTAARPAPLPAASFQTADPLGELLAEAGRLIAAKEWPAARAVLERASALAAERRDAATEADLDRRLGFVDQQLGDMGAAARDLERAIKRLDALSDRANAGQARSERGNLAFAMNDWPNVRRYYGEAADDFAAAGQPALQAGALRGQTFARDMSNEDREALLVRAWAALGDVDNPRLKGLILHQWGDVLNLRGDYARAVEKLEAADPLLAEAGRPGDYARLLTSLGRTLRLHGRADLALDVYGRALRIQEQAGDEAGQAQTYDAMAVAQWALGRMRDSIAADERAVTLARNAGSQAAADFYLGNLADSRLRAGEFSAAARDLEEILSADLNPRARGSRRQMLSEAYEGLGRLDDAGVEADRAVALTRDAGEPEYIVPALQRRARLRKRLGDMPGALVDAREALDVIEGLRASAVPRDAMKAAFVDQHHALFALTLDLLSESGDAAGGLEVAERARARAFLDLLATRAAEGTAPTESARPADFNQGPHLPSRIAVPAAKAASIRAVSSRLDSTLISYWVAPEATFVWVVARDGAVLGRRLNVSATRYETLTRSLGFNALGEALAHDSKPALRELYDLLLGPIETWLPKAPGALLTIVPHGPLFAVSFASLVDASGSYLLERYRVHYAPSASLLDFTAAGAARHDPRRLLLIADPQPPPSGAGAPLPPLPGARSEVRAIARLMPAKQVIALVGHEATEARVRAAAAGPSVLHFAAHGVLDESDPFASYLALGGSTGPAETDGRLTTAEIYGLRLDAELVVMSACRSAGGAVTGDGIAGLTRAFFYAGTPSVVATLWDLADVPARRMLTAFYREWFAGRDKATALRAAQLDLLRALRRGEVKRTTTLGEVVLPEHPGLWAGLVLIGEP